MVSVVQEEGHSLLDAWGGKLSMYHIARLDIALTVYSGTQYISTVIMQSNTKLLNVHLEAICSTADYSYENYLCNFSELVVHTSVKLSSE